MKDTKFKKGQSGNPAGRPKIVAEFRDRARKAVDEHVISAWINEVVSQGSEWVRCSELLAAYGYGKPSSSAEDREAMAAALADARPLALVSSEEILRALAGSPDKAE